MKTSHYLFLLFFISGCSSAYIPSPKNVPLLEKKGEIQIEAGASTNSIFATGSYAFSEKYALITNGSMSFQNILQSLYLDSGGGGVDSYYLPIGFSDVAHHSVEAGIGRYNFLPFSDRRLELFAGAGYGGAHTLSEHDKVSNFQCFMQVNTGKRHRRFEQGWSLRTAISGFHYQHGYYKSQFDENGNYTGNRLIIEHGNYQALHLEPLLVIRTGGQRLKVSFRTAFNLAFPLSSPSGIKTFGIDRGYTVLHFSVGMNYRF